MVQGSRNLFSRASGAAAALTLGILAGTLPGCGPAPEAEAPPVRPVRYARVIPEGSSQTRIYSGTARAALETDLSFRVGGSLIERPVDVGDMLDAGELVAALDGTDYQVKMDEALAGLARAEAQLRNEEASYDRTRGLYENQTASRSDLDAARAAAESAQAQVRASRQQLEAARLQLAYTRLSAPEQCTVARTYVEINQNVAPGQAVVHVNCGGCAEVAVSVPETEIARITPGTEVAVTFNALGSGRLKGLVQEVGVASGQTATTFPVTVGLKERCDDVRSGMAADVEFSFPSQGPPGSVIVPYVSVGEDANGRFVFVLEPAGEDRLIARRRPVSVGDATPSGLIVLEGLADGELIATAGVHRLATGQEVTLLGEP